MLHIFLVILMFTCALCAPNLSIFLPDVDGRIVGGEDTTIEEHPYQVSVQESGNHSCGGSILSERYILSAAHCFTSSVSSYSIRAGSSVHNSGGVVINVSAIYIHPEYNVPVLLNNDIAILYLESALTFSNSVSAVSLPNDDQVFADGTDAVVTGWGRTYSGATWLPLQLQAVTVPLINQPACNQFQSVTRSMICAGYPEGGKDSCQNDSGGPLVVNGVQVGIVSFGFECAAPNAPGVYVNVSVLRSFIRDITGI